MTEALFKLSKFKTVRLPDSRSKVQIPKTYLHKSHTDFSAIHLKYLDRHNCQWLINTRTLPTLLPDINKIMKNTNPGGCSESGRDGGRATSQ